PEKNQERGEETKQANLGLSPRISSDLAADSPNPMPRASGSAGRPAAAATSGKNGANPGFLGLMGVYYRRDGAPVLSGGLRGARGGCSDAMRLLDCGGVPVLWPGDSDLDALACARLMGACGFGLGAEPRSDAGVAPIGQFWCLEWRDILG
uniref:Uncharacterized protein n=1 Tax=Aegilops tauschii subsp. strangulata TaxID=200361 RepID=A0A453PVS6_AEGTS